MSDTVRFKFKASRDASETDISALLRMPGVCSVARYGMGIDEPDPTRVTDRDMGRAVEKRWEIKLDVEADAAYSFAARAGTLGRFKTKTDLQALASHLWLAHEGDAGRKRMFPA